MRTLWHFQSLAVYGYDLSGGLADTASADEFLDISSHDGRHCHRHRFRSAQPVAVVVSRSKIAHIVQTAEQERHGAEATKTATGASQVLAVRFLISKDVQERVALPEVIRSSRALRNPRCLAVPREEVPPGFGRTSWRSSVARATWCSDCSRVSRKTIVSVVPWKSFRAEVSRGAREPGGTDVSRFSGKAVPTGQAHFSGPPPWTVESVFSRISLLAFQPEFRHHWSTVSALTLDTGETGSALFAWNSREAVVPTFSLDSRKSWQSDFSGIAFVTL